MQILFLAVFIGVAVWQLVTARRSGIGPQSAGAGFGLWALAGVTASAALLAGLSIGVFVAPIAAVLFGLAGRFAGRAAAICGLPAGTGTFLLIVAAVSDGTEGPDPRTFAIVGLALVLAAGAGFLLLRTSRHK
jgi:hypothetical protein